MATTKKQNSPLQKTVAILKNKATQLNDELLIASDELIDGSVATGEKVQDLMAKVLKNGTFLLEKQQELTLDAIEMVIGQYKTGNVKFKKLIGLDKFRIRKAKAKKAKAKNINIKQKAVTKQKTTAKKSKVAGKVNLTKLNGIGPKIATILNKAGIYTYEELAITEVEELKNILAKAGKRYTAYDPSTWTKQAELAAAGKWEVLKVWVERVKKGKSNSKNSITIV